ncbi:uncharacterized protein LOC105285962 isoform X2 [Ooceraea biroi]|uniref:uncharacterized protein LOC105285962 isoform X2 n=1 Tax=Ooceraea biroi TaxID=2015173 RepID=UPI0005B84C98|nr:uncharacterized protein LOC105285962 isoform X2 [Ooceraea biroi]
MDKLLWIISQSSAKFRRSRNMICIRKRYFNWNRALLLPLGLWPDRQTKFTRFQTRLFCCFLMSSIAFQFSRLFKAECSTDHAIIIISCATFYVMLTIMFICFWINMKNTKYFLDRLQCTYNGLKDRNEMAIYDKYGYIGKRLTIILTVLIMGAVFGNFIILYLPYILDIVMSKNESYAIHIMEMVTKYFIVSEKYYFLILVHLNATCSAELIVFTATATTLMSIFKHICGMFEIASYRIEQAMTIELLRDLNTKNEILIYKNLICAVDIHRKAMVFAKCFMKKLEGSFFFLIIATVLCLSFNLFGLFHIESPTEEMEEVLLHNGAVIIILVVLFLANYTGQEITDHSNSVYVTTW